MTMTREDIEKKMQEAAEEIKPLITTLVEALCEAHQKGYLAGVELGVKMTHPHWIPVEEELPKETGWYLVATPTLNSKIDVALWDGKWRRLVTITHWMPLPESPRKEDKE